jgi:hypothetical protein
MISFVHILNIGELCPKFKDLPNEVIFIWLFTNEDISVLKLLGKYIIDCLDIRRGDYSFPTSVKKVNTSFKNVWRTWGLALPTLLAGLMIFCPLGPNIL